MIEIDGAHGEGGGQLVRMAVALSALTATPVRVVRIRAGRPVPGLASQHVTALQAVAELCSGELKGVDVGSSTIEFRPGTIAAGRYAFDVGTAGSVTLVLQAVLPVACSASDAVRLHLVGGTDVRWSPPIDYFARVFLPLLRRLGGHIDIEVQRRGYYPRGGGIAEAVVQPTRAWSPIEPSEPGPVRRVRGIAHVSNLPDDIPKRMAHAAVRRLHGFRDVKFEQRMYRGDEAIGQGGALVAWAETESALLGADSLAERGKPSDRIGEQVAAALRADLDSGAFLDVHAADQLLIYLARATGPSQFRVREISGHMETMMWLLPQFLSSRFGVARDGAGWRLTVEPKA
ncbi:MAG: RNA 3'-terminal phosphate cyclase [Methanobacteriota archaeon]|nr:MAG: RNA 3'-terminal phosphate cyclase [Euryarchaeota archaeon]TLZ79100.1 MAG: RNA 3'-terminal phosphate cyclase [Euryarchaeota archaeon]